jgi:hypothetical protein
MPTLDGVRPTPCKVKEPESPLLLLLPPPLAPLPRPDSFFIIGV